MLPGKKDIIAGLRKDILYLQGLNPKFSNKDIDSKIGVIRHAFANHSFPVSAVHEFVCTKEESESATAGFIAVLLAPLMNQGKKVIWIGSKNIFPPSLKFFGVEPAGIIFITTRNQKEITWAMEEALKCRSVAAVVGHVQGLDFTTSRRLQLAVEQSLVTGFIIRENPKSFNITASITRWKITPVPSQLEYGMPGVGFPHWNIELLKVRNGIPGKWQMNFTGNRLVEIKPVVHSVIEHKKAV